MPVIESVRIRNFKKIFDTTIHLGPITYLVGGNNSGKSSVLQGIHTAVSCAQASVEHAQKVVAETSLRYSPVADFALLGHGAPYENRADKSRGIVDFIGRPVNSSEEAEFTIEMYKARNHNNVGIGRTGDYSGFGHLISDPKRLFSIYVPGLSGVPHREEMSGYAAVFQKAASGDANLVFRNIIRLLSDRRLLQELELLIQEVLKTPVKFRVDFDPNRDLYVDVRVSTEPQPETNDFLPVDLWGTGLLQITQIFAYVLLFRPLLLLVDEPDSHLHPSRQKSLGEALERISKDFGCRVIVSTHSRHLITGASEAVNVVWMKDGKVEADEQRELTALLMDLGALDQLDMTAKTIIYTEDENPQSLLLALESGNFSPKGIKLATFNGLNNSFAAQAFQQMTELMPSSPRIIIHRDRDFLTEVELAQWSEPFSDKGIEIFCPSRCDTEAYHATPEHIASVTSIPYSQAVEIRETVIQDNLQQLNNSFINKRRFANQKYSPDGGAPRTSDLWPAGTTPTDEVLYGKDLQRKLDAFLRKKGLLKKGESLLDRASDEFQDELEAFLSSKA